MENSNNCDNLDNTFALPEYEECLELYPDVIENPYIASIFDLFEDKQNQKHEEKPQLIKYAKLEILSLGPEETNECSAKGCEEVIKALQKGNIDQFKLLLEKQDPNYIDPQTGNSLMNLVIIIAGWDKQNEINIKPRFIGEDEKKVITIYKPTQKCIGYSLAMVNILIRYGADVNKTDETGKTPLFFACQYGLFNFVEVLVNKGANVNQNTLTGISPITIATAVGDVEIVLFLLENGAKIPSEPNTINNAIKIAKIYNRRVILRILKNRITQG